ncbi:hypothetical protein ANCCAN_14695, partial [Ancylostoma caninum]
HPSCNNYFGELPRVPPVPGSDDYVVAGNVADSPVRRAPVAEVSLVRARVEQNRDLHSTPPADAPGPSQEHLAKENLEPTQKLAYYANFAMHFGLSQSMRKHVDDLCLIFSGETSDLAASDALCTLSAERFPKYEYRKMYYCIQCDQSTPSAIASCRNEECAVKGVNPTRSKNLRRTSIHFVKIKPQLEIVLKRNLKTLSEVHRNIHTGVVNALRPNTSYFDDYQNDIESRGEFLERNLRIILTLNFD